MPDFSFLSAQLQSIPRSQWISALEHERGTSEYWCLVHYNGTNVDDTSHFVIKSMGCTLRLMQEGDKEDNMQKVSSLERSRGFPQRVSGSAGCVVTCIASTKQGCLQL